MKNNKVLLTGGAGFIGSNYVQHALETTQDEIYILDKMTYAGDLRNLDGILGQDRVVFIKGDICDEGFVSDLFREQKFMKVLHFAAESHVDNSITGPAAFVETNIVGTFTLLQNAYKTWMEGPNNLKEGFEKARFLHVSTDEVYGTLGDTGLFTEETPYAPNSPYSASKASSDFIVRSFFHTYGMPVITTNCSNNYGPNQHKEKLIPTIIRKAISGEAIPIYGDGKNVRDWLYVLDHCKGIQLALDRGDAGRNL